MQRTIQVKLDPDHPFDSKGRFWTLAMFDSDGNQVTPGPGPKGDKGDPGDPGVLGLLGDGGDGAVVLDGAADFSFASRVGMVYSLKRDIYATDLTINAGVTVIPTGQRIFCTGTLTNNGTIAQDGADATGVLQNPPNPVGGTAVIALGQASNAPTTGAGASSGNGTWGGGGGGAGGAGTNAGGSAFGTAAAFADMWRSILSPISSNNGKGGQGASGGGDATNKGGQGGNGAGMIWIAAREVVNNGTLRAKGGNGSDGVAGNTGGGGGGGGGVIVVYSTDPISGSGTVSVVGGTKGNGVGTGVAGVDGYPGSFVNATIG